MENKNVNWRPMRFPCVYCKQDHLDYPCSSELQALRYEVEEGQRSKSSKDVKIENFYRWLIIISISYFVLRVMFQYLG